MFARSPSRETRTAEPLRPAVLQTAPPLLAAVAAEQPARPAVVHALSAAGPLDRTPVSIIGRDLVIAGTGLRIVTKGVLQVDGEVVGDVEGAEIVIGEHGKVTGVVHGETVVVRGAVAGTIRGVRVTLAARAQVEGEIHHRSLAIEQGAMFEGKARRHLDDGELRPAGKIGAV